MLAAVTTPAIAQDPIRPWLDWRTIETANYRFHFPRELEAWTREAAVHVESVDSALRALVGYSAPKPVHVVVDDPFSIANGYALPFLDGPVSVWWAVPPDPRTDVGNYREWGEMLSVHEMAHLAHMTRPSRNRFQRFLWSLPPVQFGPITRKGSRWLWEGYATLVEGRLTGTGRPNNVWRPAVLRQWAIEGRLPSYGQLNALGGFKGGEFAYFGGSAFLEWLTDKDGDSALTHLWRRMTAVRNRSFNAAFAGVFGDAPPMLYAKHTAELTHDAVAAKQALEIAGLVEGELIQRLNWTTGDPAISPDGQRVAIALRDDDSKPARVVVWRTGPEPLDTVAIRKRREEIRRDPEDVPDRRFYPPPKRAHRTLYARNGRSYLEPRWFADSRRVLVTRWAPRSDGTMRPELYVWNTDSGGVRRVTHGSGLRNADPHPSGSEAVAVQCGGGHCDVARVDLATGVVTTLLAGDLERSYYRPRYSPRGDRLVASVSDSGRWRLVVADRDGRNARYVDPDDGANRYDAQWLRGGDSLVVVSERGGIPNLELVSVGNRGVRSLTRVTGAAVAPDVDPRDGAIWFLSLHSRGFDVRRFPRGAAPADSVVPILADRFGFAGLRAERRDVARFETNPVSHSRAYGTGPRRQRFFIPNGYHTAESSALIATLYSGDIVGRLNATVSVSYNLGASPLSSYNPQRAWDGASLRSTWRYPRPALEIGVHGFMDQPTRGRHPQPAADSLDARSLQTLLATSMSQQGDGWRLRTRVGGAYGKLRPRLNAGTQYDRAQGFAETDLQLQQMRGTSGLVERVQLHATHGQTRAEYQRLLARLEIGTTGSEALPLLLSATLGRVAGTPHPYELFAVGGALTPVADSSLMSQRYDMPMFPTAISTGRALFAWRAAMPFAGGALFYEGASTSGSINNFRKWNRAVGAELNLTLPPIPVAFAPRIETRDGIAYTLDQPFRKRVQVYFEIRMEP